ncbi:hypothetical protein [Nakamurella lactea]|uniref:hypothetical protein n=1 Tax=Nakamurella lactea TaxID=459515 RepID=UPI000412B9D6|nr:hypothetical protein [Nakamurella lactea]
MIVWVVVLLGGGIAATWVTMAHAPVNGPSAPYDHAGLSESSVATEDVVAGQARTVVAGLRSIGYWCVQPRRNVAAVQIACRSAGGDVRDDRGVRIDLQVAANGDLLYADIDLPSSDAADRMWTLLDASFLRLWPQQRSVIAGLVENARPHTLMGNRPLPPSDPDDQYLTHEARTSVASWSLLSFYTGWPLALRVRTPGLQDRSWPFDGGHYATTLSDAIGQLTAAGFGCATSCYRAGDNQVVDFESFDDQIVTIGFRLRTRTDTPAAGQPAAEWVRSGLPFLTPAVRTAVGSRIEQSLVERQDWHGVVAGTPVNIVAVPGGTSTADGHPARDLSVAIGIPLLHVD